MVSQPASNTLTRSSTVSSTSNSRPTLSSRITSAASLRPSSSRSRWQSQSISLSSSPSKGSSTSLSPTPSVSFGAPSTPSPAPSETNSILSVSLNVDFFIVGDGITSLVSGALGSTMLDSVATVTDDTIMAAALPDGGTLASEKTTKAFFASIQVYASTESLSVLLSGGINLTAIAASKSSKLLNSWAPTTPGSSTSLTRRRLAADMNMNQMCASRLLLATTTSTQFTLITIVVVVAGSLLSKIGVTDDKTAVSTLASQGIDTWAGLPDNSFTAAWQACTGVSSAIYVSPVRVLGVSYADVRTSPRLPTQNVGAIVGGTIAGLILATVAIYYMYNNRLYRKREELKRKNDTHIISPRAEAAWPDDIYVDDENSPRKSTFHYNDDDDDDVTNVDGDDHNVVEKHMHMNDNDSMDEEGGSTNVQRTLRYPRVDLPPLIIIPQMVTMAVNFPPLKLLLRSPGKTRPAWGAASGTRTPQGGIREANLNANKKQNSISL